ncbi:hypothetical protein BJ165DRAFT_1422896 [Panaeolus papilionaceus]|nr:hypothetical protein BJ165DRAFT_1422896 [Panaeolus papilionaceus]
MPRILPRLIKNIQEKKSRTQNFPFPSKSQKNKRSLYKNISNSPSLHPSNYSSSILLHPKNPIIHSNIYQRHKTLPPSIRRPNTKKINAPDVARQRTKEETEWWSNPYLRMLASPIRQCFVTERYLPTGTF